MPSCPDHNHSHPCLIALCVTAMTPPCLLKTKEACSNASYGPSLYRPCIVNCCTTRQQLIHHESILWTHSDLHGFRLLKVHHLHKHMQGLRDGRQKARWPKSATLLEYIIVVPPHTYNDFVKARKCGKGSLVKVKLRTKLAAPLGARDCFPQVLLRDFKNAEKTVWGSKLPYLVLMQHAGIRECKKNTCTQSWLLHSRDLLL